MWLWLLKDFPTLFKQFPFSIVQNCVSTVALRASFLFRWIFGHYGASFAAIGCVMPGSNRKEGSYHLVLEDNMALLSRDDLRKQENMLLPVRSSRYQMRENRKWSFRGNVQQPYRKRNNSTQPIDSVHYLEAFPMFLACPVGWAKCSLAQSQFRLVEASISPLLPPHFPSSGDTIYAYGALLRSFNCISGWVPERH